MKTVRVILTGIVLLILYGCGGEKQTESQTAVPAPKTDLHSAVVLDDLDAIRQHIKAGSDLNVLEPSHASTPLITAAAMGKSAAAKLLIDAGADLNYQNADGATALITASVFGNTGIAQMLIDAGADLNIQSKDGSTALHTAAFFCREDIVKALLQKGIDTSLRNKYGQTAYETVDQPFENVVKVYDTVGAGMKSLGVQLDYDHIRKTRPKIAQLLEPRADKSEK